jgi:hypothetical protein
LLNEANPFHIFNCVQPESTCAANWFGQEPAFLVETNCINRERSALRKFANLHSGCPAFVLGRRHKNTIWSVVQSQEAIHFPVVAAFFVMILSAAAVGSASVFRVNALVKTDHSSRRPTLHYLAMKVTQKQTQAVRCPTCGAKPGERCELTTGQPRTEPHRDRRLAASEK